MYAYAGHDSTVTRDGLACRKTAVDAANQVDRRAARMQLRGTDTEDVATIFVSRTVGTGKRMANTLNGFSGCKNIFFCITMKLHYFNFMTKNPVSRYLLLSHHLQFDVSIVQTIVDIIVLYFQSIFVFWIDDANCESTVSKKGAKLVFLALMYFGRATLRKSS